MPDIENYVFLYACTNKHGKNTVIILFIMVSIDLAEIDNNFGPLKILCLLWSNSFIRSGDIKIIKILKYLSNKTK